MRKQQENFKTDGELNVQTGWKLISLIEVMLCSGQNLSITKGNDSLIMQKRLMVLVHCTLPHQDLPTNEVSS